MVSWKKLMCVAFVCFYLGFMVCLANAAQQAPEPETVKTKAELKREKKARDAEKIKARREAAAKAKRQAAEKAKAERKEKARLAALDANAKKEAKPKSPRQRRRRKPSWQHWMLKPKIMLSGKNKSKRSIRKRSQKSILSLHAEKRSC